MKKRKEGKEGKEGRKGRKKYTLVLSVNGIIHPVII